MALQATDSRFDWCDQLIRARQNFSIEECCNCIKTELSKLKGADPAYVAAIQARPAKDFPASLVYFPVYETTITATYTWDTVQKDHDTSTVSDIEFRTTTTTTTTHRERESFNRTYHQNVHEDLNVTKYAGRSDQRFFQLDHVDDLKAGIYNDSCIYTEAAMKNEVKQAAEKNKPHKNAFVNQWSCTACMIPILIITVTYQGNAHKWYFNAHNGSMHGGGYLVSQRVAEAVSETLEKVRIPHIVTHLISTATIIISFMTMDWANHWFATLLSLAISIFGGLVLMIFASSYQSRSSLQREFGANGPNVEGQYKCSKQIMGVSIGIMIWCIFSAIVW